MSAYAFARHRQNALAAGVGWVMVPREPTEAMIQAGEEVSVQSFIPADGWERMVYSAMIAAAPVTEPAS